MTMTRIRIVVADQGEAIFYDSASLEAAPREVARISDPAAHLHARDFGSERPGRTHESMGETRHAIARENDPHRREAVQFARRVAKRLDDARQHGEFDDLVVVAAPAFLGLMRGALSRATKARVVHEVRKDLVHGTVDDLRRHLPGPDEGLRAAH
jgi:protein required for attachment to host cells